MGKVIHVDFCRSIAVGDVIELPGMVGKWRVLQFDPENEAMLVEPVLENGA